MLKHFNVTGACNPEEHYMVKLDKRLEAIRGMVDDGKYFIINKARQYGKTTTLLALKDFLKNDYVVISMDFQTEMSSAKFRDENTFSIAFARSIVERLESTDVYLYEELIQKVKEFKDLISYNREYLDLVELFRYINMICQSSAKPVVLMIDEVDRASNNQVFLDFLSMLRGYYLKRREKPTFKSVILAGVYDIKYIKQKIGSSHEEVENSPWNIAADFDVDMDFNCDDIVGMLEEYENDKKTGMSIAGISELIYDYSSGYPFLVSRICQIMDEKLLNSDDMFKDLPDVWTRRGVLQAVNILETEKNSLFDSMAKQLHGYPEMKSVIEALLFQGKEILYTPFSQYADVGVMFGFVKINGNRVEIANRIFESVLYTSFLADEQMKNKLYDTSISERNQFIVDNALDMRLIITKFTEHFTDIYSEQDSDFVEENGRKLFLLYLKPIINGTGNYYIESQTRDKKRTDVIVDYLGKQYIVEMKIWHGQEYNSRGEKQLIEYLEYYHQDIGYMVSFNFNKNKKVGVHTTAIGDKTIVEAVV